MDIQILHYIILPLAFTGICYIIVTIIFIRNESRVLPKNSVAVTTRELDSMKSEMARKENIVLLSEQEIRRLKGETERLKDESARFKNEALRLKDELTKKEAASLAAPADAEGAKRARAESELLKNEVIRLERELAEAKFKIVQDAKERETPGIPADRAEVDALKGELAKTTEDLKALQLRAMGFAKTQGDEQSKKEIEKLKLEIQARSDESAKKEKDLEKANAELARLSADSGRLAEKEQEARKLGSELASLQSMYKTIQVKAEAADANEIELKRLRAEIERITQESKTYREQAEKLKSADADIAGIEKALNEEKKAVHELKLKLGENKIKIQLLNDKTKETVEEIAKFAEGKEFEEFRRSVHMDDMIRKYEDEIKDLKLKNIELEKRQSGGRA